MAVYLKVLPLALMFGLGFLAKRWQGVRKEDVAALLIYFITPLIVLRGIMAVELDRSRLLLPLIVFSLACVFCWTMGKIAKKFFPPPAVGILSYTVGNCNSGYIGLPLATTLLGEAAFAQAVLISFGFILFENTLGFYVTARGRHTPRESVKKLFGLPSLYAFAVGMILNLMNVHSLAFMDEILGAARGAYTLLGMMLVGMALADVRERALDWAFCAFAFSAKFILWPVSILFLVYLDKHYLFLLDRLARQGLMVAAFLPLAANTVAFASALKAEPEKSAVAVFFSTILAFLLLPLLEYLLRVWP